MSGAPLPAAWARMISALREAQVARDVMRDPAARQTDRDEAVVRYSRAADAIIADLGILSETHVLGRITLMLSRRERS